MKKTVIIIVATFVVLIGFYIVVWKLPLTINRHSDIQLGEKIIENIEDFKKTNGLPIKCVWKTFKKLGFRDNRYFFQPEYHRLDSENYELIFLEGFDIPYLMWNSNERIWKEGYPIFSKKL